jgi:ribonuclease E
MKKEMLINAAQPEEIRIAIVEDGVLEELYVERASQESYVGNIYKGKIVNIEPSIQAAFVDFGVGRNGFLHVSDVDPVYYKHLLPKHVVAEIEAEQDEEFGGGNKGRDRGGRGGRDRDRGDRGDRGPRRDEPAARDRGPKELTTWLEAEPAAPTQAEGPDEDGDFGVGLEDEAPPARPEARREERPTPPPPPAPRAEAARPAPQPTPVAEEEDEDTGFGAGLLEDEPAVAPITTEAELTATIEEAVIELEPAAPPAEEPAAEEKPKPRPRSRSRAKPKAEEPPAAAEGEEPKAEDGGAKAKGRSRRGKKKADGDEDDGDAPKVMPGAERRTAPDDEGEVDGFGAGLDDAPAHPASEEAVAADAEDVADAADVAGAAAGEDEHEVAAPFFGGDAADDFDVDAPNDRFAGGGKAPPGERRDRGGRRKPQPVAAADEDDEPAAGFADDEDGDDAPTAVEDEADDLDDVEIPVPKMYDDDEGGGRRRDRGGRGGDRGDRGPRRGDRGPRRDDRGGPGGKPGGGRPPRDKGFPRLPIEQIFKRGQEVIVQVIKEGIGTKGPTLSTYVSIAGRYLVLMPSLNRVGVSRKIEDFEARRRLRDIMNDLNPPKGVGFIVRTAAVDRDPQELQNDLAYLLRLWQVVVRRIKKVPAPVEIYRESDMITRTIRDIFTKDVDAIWVDDPTAFQHAQEFLQIVMPKYADRIKLHEDSQPLFHRHRLEEEIAKLNQKRLEMPQGGSIIIEQTEALVAIDVNSGTFRAENNAEETAFRMNILAAKEIARQLRLRDLGGVIVNDFIDMRDEKHRREVERTLRDALRRDRARTKILRISQFGIIEMTRQRMQQSLKKRIYNDCPHCKGSGYVKTSETLAIDAMRLLQLAAARAMTGTPAVTSVRVTVCQESAFYLLNRKRREIAALEDRAKMEVIVSGLPAVSPDHLDFKCYDSNGNEVRLLQQGPPPRMFQGGGRPPRIQERRFPQHQD